MVLDAASLVRSVSTVASLPSIYDRLRTVISRPLSSARDIGGVVSEDPGLTARLLKLVNSAFFGFPGRIDTVSRAITIVGTHQLSDLTLATSVIKAFDSVPQDLVDMTSFWCHSLAVGVCARVIASQRREDNVERFFVAGMLHDIGLPIMYMKLPREMRQILERSKATGELLDTVEKAVLSYDHTDVGRFLLKGWNLPESLQEAVHFHHHPERAQHFPVEAAAIHLADLIATALDMGSGGEYWVPPLDVKAWDFLGLNINTIPAMWDEIQCQYEDVVKIMLGKGK